MKKTEANGERGQIIVIVATAFLLIVLSTAAVTIDMGNGLLQQRRLQNVADAAALAAASEMARGGTEANAISLAENLVSSNTAGTVTLPAIPTGTGVDLTSGIEINGGVVRVALQRQVDTFVAPVIGVNSIGVGARAKAGTTEQGVLPVAVKRFSAGDTAFDLGTHGNPNQVIDYLAKGANSEIATWPNPVSSPSGYPPGFTDPDHYSPTVSGPIAPFIGHDALANVANGNDFHFWVAPDVRQLTSVTPQYYNGVLPSNSIQDLKNLESTYFYPQAGYAGSKIPAVGDELAAINGTNTSATVDALRKRYTRGSVVSALVYNGTVYRKPDFTIQIDQVVLTSDNIAPAAHPVTFNLSIIPVNNFSGTVQLSADGITGWGDWQFEGSGSANSEYSVAVSGSPQPVRMKVSSTTGGTGARTLQIKAVGSGVPKTASVTVVVGSAPVYSISSATSYRVVEQGSSTRFDLDVQGWNDYGTTTVQINPPEWVGGTPSNVTVSRADTSVSVNHNGNPNATRLNVDVGNTASVGSYTLKLPLTDGNHTLDQAIYLSLQIIYSESAGNVSATTSFVKVLGYANFVITYANNSPTMNSVDSNTVYAYAVSGIKPSLADLPQGRAARLLPWR